MPDRKTQPCTYTVSCGEQGTWERKGRRRHLGAKSSALTERKGKRKDIPRESHQSGPSRVTDTQDRRHKPGTSGHYLYPGRSVDPSIGILNSHTRIGTCGPLPFWWSTEQGDSAGEEALSAQLTQLSRSPGLRASQRVINWLSGGSLQTWSACSWRGGEGGGVESVGRHTPTEDSRSPASAFPEKTPQGKNRWMVPQSELHANRKDHKLPCQWGDVPVLSSLLPEQLNEMQFYVF